MSSRINYINLEDQETKLLSQEQESEAEEEEEEEATISLCDFPLNSNESDDNILSPKSQDLRRSSSQPSDFFEFFNDSISEETYSNMSHAEDIILCGKLVPYAFKQPAANNPFDHGVCKSMSQDDDDDRSVTLSRRYCDSLPETKVTRSNSMGNNNSTRNYTLMMRSSRSLDYNKLRRNSSLVMKSEVSDIRRNIKSLDDHSALKGSSSYKNYNNKPSWYALMFGGLVKVSRQELDIRDMKLRQSRRSMGTMFPGMVAGDGNVPATNRRSFWGHDLLKVLSCKSHSSLAFTEPSVVPCHNYAV